MGKQAAVSRSGELMIKRLPLDEISIDEGLQPRQEPLDPEWIAHLTLSDLDDWPPLDGVEREGRFVVLDGRHRLAAAQELELSEIACRYREVSDDEDLRGIAFTLNRQHGKPLTLKDRRAEAERKLKRDPRVSDREIGKHCGLDNKTVAAVRAKLELTEEIPQSATRIGQDGRTTKPAAAKSTSRKSHDPRKSATPQPHQSQESLAALTAISTSMSRYFDNYARDGLSDALVMAISVLPQSDWESMTEALDLWGSAALTTVRTLREKLKQSAKENQDIPALPSVGEMPSLHPAHRDEETYDADGEKAAQLLVSYR